MGASSSFDYGRTSDTTRNFSPTIWNQVDVSQLRAGIDGYLIEDDFFDYASTKWQVTQATSGTMALSNLEGGTVILDSGATTSTQGPNVQYGGTNTGASIVAPASGLLLYEARLKITTAMSTGPNFFAGLSEYNTAIIASSALATSKSYAGFSSVTADGVLLGCSGDGTNAATSVVPYGSNTGLTLVADTYIKLGFVIKNRSTMTMFVNGQKSANTITTYLPTTAKMRLSFVCQSRGTLQPTMDIDRVRVAVWNGAL